MIRLTNKLLFVFVLCMIIFNPIPGKSALSDHETTIKAKINGMKKYEGYFNFYWDEQHGKIWLEIDKWETEFLYINSLRTGVGSNDIGLDRGQLGQSRIVAFHRIGPKVLLIQPNYSFRAISDNPSERRAVKESFARSTLWGFEVAAETDDRVLVDASNFFLRDAHHVVESLMRSEQGRYSPSDSRSAFYLPRTKNFPRNTEIEATLTFVGDSPGSWVTDVVPTPRAITVGQHHSFVQLPDPHYEPREFDPRAGFYGVQFMDFAAPVGRPITKRFISRHRLKKKHPEAAKSEPIEPIVYYVDRGAPEPIRSALIEGASWWNQAFEAAGYKNAFQVKPMPKDADLMDVRYNVIQWVHRATRGWSYGGSVTDPRTGEIIKGHVTLGSQRVRQDYLIAEGLLAPYEKGKPVPSAMKQIALARLRQLSAHEVGHTLGISHNFASSVWDRASVMDYPHPLITINENGSLDWSNAYDTGIGEWDKVTIAYGYQDFPNHVDEKDALNKIIANSIKEGFIYISDQDARPDGGAHPLAHLWDNGANAVDELLRIMKVRAVAIEQFGERNIREGMPMSSLEEVLVPVYLYHRYQLKAASKVLGGLYYTYAVRSDGQTVTKLIQPREQREALDALLSTLQPEALALPENIVQMIPPKAFGYRRNRETFNIRTGVTFDPLAAAETAANMTIRLIFHPERAARLVEYHARDDRFPGFTEIMEEVIKETWKSAHGSGYHAEIKRVVDQAVLYHLMRLASNKEASSQVRAIAYMKIKDLKNWLVNQKEKTNDESRRAHYLFAISQIQKFQKDPENINLTRPVAPPAGAPIGTIDDINWLLK